MQRPLEGQPAAQGSAEPLGGGLNEPEIGDDEAILRTENALVVVLDLTPVAWTGSLASGEPRLQLCGLYSLLHRFLKTFAYMSAQSRCCVIGVHSSGTRIIYEGVLSNDWLSSCFEGDQSQDERVTASLLQVWNAMLDFIGSWSPSSGDPQLTTALSMGLLYLNRLRITGAGYGRRIIIFDVSGAKDYREQYIRLMNVAFTAAKSFWFLPSEAVSEQLSTQLPFDFSNTAVCYCHYRTVDIAFLCPCCFAGKLVSSAPHGSVVYCSEKDDKGKYRIFCFVCNEWQHEPLPVPLRLREVVEKVGVQGRLDKAGDPADLADVKRAVQTHRHHVVGGDVLHFPLLVEHGQLRQDRDALQPDGVGPHDVEETVPVRGEKREHEHRAKQVLLVGESIHLAVVRLCDRRGEADEVDRVGRREEEQHLKYGVVQADIVEHEIQIPGCEHDEVKLLHTARNTEAVLGELELEDENDQTGQVAHVTREPKYVHRHCLRFDRGNVLKEAWPLRGEGRKAALALKPSSPVLESEVRHQRK
ncbi:transcription initiation factor TFIIH subunit 3 [Babesia ovata]|uniref:Transcription initiation factor TFIIH subunit 3 n=1 Tax=Babesia ovata TaxID=189622 RepID=A0A2H6K6K7_9APIC|nr:transcription initiation factor TFIIH subunit 3 [Babesia ovata]GBE58612.1 transcription initiation factor TFIIH subunit 3 [Babesia ovata]